MPRNIQVAKVKMFKAAAKGERMAGVKPVPMREDDEPKRTLDPKRRAKLETLRQQGISFIIITLSSSLSLLLSIRCIKS